MIAGLAVAGQAVTPHAEAATEWQDWNTFLRIAARVSLDNERFLFALAGAQPPSYKAQLQYYWQAVAAVLNGGLDPFEYGFWDKVKLWIDSRKNPAYKNTEAADYGTMKASFER